MRALILTQQPPQVVRLRAWLWRYGVGGDKRTPAVLGSAGLRGRKCAGRSDDLVAVFDPAGISRERKLSAGCEPIAPDTRRSTVACVADRSPQKLVGFRRDRRRSGCRISVDPVPDTGLIERRRGEVCDRRCINRQVAHRMNGDDVAGPATGTVNRKDLRVTTIPVRRANVLMQGDAIPCDLGGVALVIGGDQQGLTCLQGDAGYVEAFDILVAGCTLGGHNRRP
jgi:hypothetical protein